MKPIIFIITFILMSSIVFAADFTFRQHQEVDLKIPCFDINNTYCDETVNCTLTVNKPSGDNVINNQEMNNNTNFAFYNYTLNVTTQDSIGIYDATMYCCSPYLCDYARFTYEITASGKDVKTSTAGLAVVMFLLFIILFLLYLGFQQRDFTESVLVNLIIKRSIFVLAIYIMILNTTMVATIAGAANLELTKELFTYMTIFGYAGYIGMLVLVFKTTIDYFRMWRAEKNKDRYGDY